MDVFGSEDLDLDVAGDALTAVTGSLTGALMALTKGDTAIDRDTTLVALDALEADYVGYAREAIVWQAASIGDDGEVEVVGVVGEFRPSDAVAPNDIWALYIVNAAETKKYAAARFDGPPYPMQDALDAIIVTVRWKPRTSFLAVVVS